MNVKEQKAAIQRMIEWVTEDVSESIKNAYDHEEKERYEQYSEDFSSVGNLIESAPDMLKALESAMGLIELCIDQVKVSNDIWEKTISEMNTAINSATE